LVTTAAAAVELNCSLPSYADFTSITQATPGVAGAFSLTVSVHHFAKVSSADTFSAKKTLLPYSGLHGGDVITITNAAPPSTPPPPPSPPPSAPPVPPASPPPPENKSCYQIYKSNPQAKNGMYDVKMDGPSGPAKKMYCHMEDRGGGWTLIARLGVVRCQ